MSDEIIGEMTRQQARELHAIAVAWVIESWLTHNDAKVKAATDKLIELVSHPEIRRLIGDEQS